MSHDTLHRDRTIPAYAQRIHRTICNLCHCSLEAGRVDVKRPDLSGGIRHYPCCPTCAAILMQPYDHDQDSDKAYKGLWAAMGIEPEDRSGRRCAKAAGRGQRAAG